MQDPIIDEPAGATPASRSVEERIGARLERLQADREQTQALLRQVEESLAATDRRRSELIGLLVRLEGGIGELQALVAPADPEAAA